jgi:hypothetical protein
MFRSTPTAGNASTSFDLTSCTSDQSRRRPPKSVTVPSSIAFALAYAPSSNGSRRSSPIPTYNGPPARAHVRLFITGPVGHVVGLAICAELEFDYGCLLGVITFRILDAFGTT